MFTLIPFHILELLQQSSVELLIPKTTFDKPAFVTITAFSAQRNVHELNVKDLSIVSVEPTPISITSPLALDVEENQVERSTFCPFAIVRVAVKLQGSVCALA